MQQQSAATTPTGTDLRRPEMTSDLRQRPLMTPVGLVHTEEIMRIAGNVRPSWSLCGAGPARAEIHSHLPGQGYYVATLLIRNGDLVVGQHGGQVLQR